MAHNPLPFRFDIRLFENLTFWKVRLRTSVLNWCVELNERRIEGTKDRFYLFHSSAWDVSTKWSEATTLCHEQRTLESLQLQAEPWIATPIGSAVPLDVIWCLFCGLLYGEYHQPTDSRWYRCFFLKCYTPERIWGFSWRVSPTSRCLGHLVIESKTENVSTQFNTPAEMTNKYQNLGEWAKRYWEKNRQEYNNRTTTLHDVIVAMLNVTRAVRKQCGANWSIACRKRRRRMHSRVPKLLSSRWANRWIRFDHCHHGASIIKVSIIIHYSTWSVLYSPEMSISLLQNLVAQWLTSNQADAAISLRSKESVTLSEPLGFGGALEERIPEILWEFFQNHFVSVFMLFGGQFSRIRIKMGPYQPLPHILIIGRTKSFWSFSRTCSEWIAWSCLELTRSTWRTKHGKQSWCKQEQANHALAVDCLRQWAKKWPKHIKFSVLIKHCLRICLQKHQVENQRTGTTKALDGDFAKKLSVFSCLRQNPVSISHLRPRWSFFSYCIRNSCNVVPPVMCCLQWMRVRPCKREVRLGLLAFR